MSVLPSNQVQLIVFVLLDTSGVEVTGLGTTFTLQISKNGGAFAGSTGVKAEIGSGWYSYQLTEAETDATGPLAIKVTGAGVDQLNLSYEIRPYSTEEPAGATILTAAEGANVLRCLTTDGLMLQLLPLIDDYIELATGRDWAADTTIEPIAKAAAQMLLVQWHENPAMLGTAPDMAFGLGNVIGQLQAKALLLASSGVPSEALAISASMPKDGDEGFAITANLTVIFSHAMATAATNCVSLATAAGTATIVVSSLDVTTKIMTINPTGSLMAETDYILTIDAAPDTYGGTLTETIAFKTA